MAPVFAAGFRASFYFSQPFIDSLFSRPVKMIHLFWHSTVVLVGMVNQIAAVVLMLKQVNGFCVHVLFLIGMLNS